MSVIRVSNENLRTSFGWRQFGSEAHSALAAPAIVATGDQYNLEINRRDNLGFDHLMAALATADENFLRGLLNQLVDASARKSRDSVFFDEDHLNYLLATINGNKPQDQNEAMLCAQWL